MEPLPPKPPGSLPETPPAPQEQIAAPSAAPSTDPAPPDPLPEAAGTAPARRPRGRTSLILAAAALLGVAGGVATGYTVQADRAPTPLPPLSQASLSYPDGHLSEDAWEPLPAKHDHRVKTDGDLRKLLVHKPKGSQDSTFHAVTDGWLGVEDYARDFVDPAQMFSGLASQDVRRIAATQWEESSTELTYVQLVQFNEATTHRAANHAREQLAYMPGEEFAGNPGVPLEGSSTGRAFVFDEPSRNPGFLPLYEARAIAHRGDIMMDIRVTDTAPVSEKEIQNLAEQQLERL
ncbi:hypothetical protein [Streptomyces sp. TR06-5]|uniref:hypothetical protein n=1 Tax=Streptomyces sp. TR06-5 TaxID=3385976 RepID=UPI00399FB971